MLLGSRERHARHTRKTDSARPERAQRAANVRAFGADRWLARSIFKLLALRFLLL